MRFAKRIFLFMAVNILIVTMITIAMSLLGIQPYLEMKGLNYPSLIAFCLLWGFGGAFISLALSRVMAKWMMGVKLVEASAHDPQTRDLVRRVHELAAQAGLRVMPQVGVYDSPELNAFATGPTRNRSLVAVSSGLLASMNDRELDGVLAHEVAHIANGDMITMTLVQGVMNAFVMFLARIAAYFASQFVDEEKRPLVQIVMVIAFEIVLGLLAMTVVAFVSRRREFRADAGGAQLAGPRQMIAALERLKQNAVLPEEKEPALATLKISGRQNKWLQLFSTHPDLDVRIARLRSNSLGT